uniref:Endosome-associated-trafficking regulator 1 n=1 Tax=Anopheles gambiae TaxID=7165 RepID=A0A453Z079_ANOGA
MAKDNNNINTDDLTAATPSSSVKAAPASSSTAPEGPENGPSAQPAEPQSTSPSLPPASSSTPEVAPRREENPFSFKHFLKWDGNHTTNGGGASAGGGSAASSINHSRSASSINGHGMGSSLADGSGGGGGGTGGTGNTNGTHEGKAGLAGANGSTLTTVTTVTTSTGSPSKSATTSSLNVVSSTTGARPKIPQFQSVNTLSSESKMKRSPRFPSFDSQSSLSDFADDRFGSIYQSRSNGSFSSDYPAAGGGVGGSATAGGGLREDANGMEQLGEQVELLRGYVQRSYSNFDLDSPGSSAAVAAVDRRNELEMHNEPPGRGLVGAAEFSAALPDFVQDHLVMEQWYNTLPKGTGSGSSGSAEFDDVLDLTGVANVSGGGGGGAPLSSCNDIPFDLTASSTTSSSRVARDPNTTPVAGHRHSMGVRLDLPSRSGAANLAGPAELGFDLPPRSPTSSSSELPPDLTEGNAGGGGDAGGSGGRSRSYYYSVSPPPGSSGTTGDNKIHRLPDFLSDGPIHSSGRLADVTHDTPHASESSSSATMGGYRQSRRQWETQYQNRLGAESLENERLRRELEASRRTVGEQSRRIRELERDLETMVSLARPGGASGSTQSNASSFLQAKTRAVTAEAEMKQLRQKLSNMSVEMEALRRENETLKEEACGGAIGGSTGAGASARVRQDDGTGDLGNRTRRDRSSAFLRAQTVALRQAASTAESNLRQLLSGVENLRSMANQIETFRNTQDEVKSEGVSIPLEDYLHDVGVNSDDDDDDDDDDEPFGPAL